MVSWPARFELIHSEPWFVVDGAHNPQCAAALAESIEHYFPENKRVLLMGVLRDKDYEQIAELLTPLFDEVVTVTPSSPRALPAAELAELISRHGVRAQAAESIEQGVGMALDIAEESGAMVCACGSLYICGAVRACFGLR